MATWHVTAKPTVGEGHLRRTEIQSLHLKNLRQLLTDSGFKAEPMPIQHTPALTVRHQSESALTLFMLKHAVLDCEFNRVV